VELEIATLQRSQGQTNTPRCRRPITAPRQRALPERSDGDAEREYRAAIAVNGKLGEAHNNLAVVLLLTGRAAERRKR